MLEEEADTASQHLSKTLSLFNYPSQLVTALHEFGKGRRARQIRCQPTSISLHRQGAGPIGKGCPPMKLNSRVKRKHNLSFNIDKNQANATSQGEGH